MKNKLSWKGLVFCFIYFIVGVLLGWGSKSPEIKTKTKWENLDFNLGDTVYCVDPMEKIIKQDIIVRIIIADNKIYGFDGRTNWRYVLEKYVFKDSTGANSYLCEIYAKEIMKLEQKQKEEMEALELERDKACNFGGEDEM